jgi:general secretion pathway protein E
MFGLKREPVSDKPISVPASVPFVDFLVAESYIDSASAQRATSAVLGTRQAVDVVLLELGLLHETKLADALARYLSLDRIGPEAFPMDLPAGDMIQRDYLKSMGLLPVEITNNSLVVATARPMDADPARALAYFLGRDLVMKVAVGSELNSHLARLLAVDAQDTATSNLANDSDSAPQDDDIERLKDVAREAPIIRLLNRLIVSAIERNASDIHIEPLEDHVRIRFRMDGALQIVETLGKNVQAGLLSRVKILARLNIAEHRLPQDGRIRIPVRGRDVDLRVSTTPALYGESIVLRILDRQDLPLDFLSLGYAPDAAKQIEALISAPNGVVLVTGPTGSGKTTTLYAALTMLNRVESKLFTVEDPVEYHLDGVNQIHVRPQIGLDFAAVLRSILRQDPDIIMVGEIRDLETARIAVQASLTGHLVLSTLHTNSAAASLTRLLDMGMEDYLLVSCIRGIVAQRLVRKLCPACRQPFRPSEDLLMRFNLHHQRRSILRFYQARGCADCHGTGYRGRTVIYEILEMKDEIKNAVLRRETDTQLEALARKSGMANLFETGLQKVILGETSVEEILRVAVAPVQ